MRLKNKAYGKSHAAIGCLCLIAFFCMGPSVLADGENPFMAKVKEVLENTIVVEVSDTLQSAKVRAGQELVILIPADLPFKDSHYRLIQKPRLNPGHLLEIKPDTFSGKEVSASYIRVIGR